MNPGWERKRVFIIVRTYPVPATSGIEVSCTAAITHEGEWVRLFPVPYRLLDYDKRFSKYQWIDVDVRKPTNDPRRESYRINPDSIEIVETVGTGKGTWRRRDEILTPVRACCLCCLQAEQKANGFPTLGMFRPTTIRDLVIEPEPNPEWTPDELGKLSQQPLWGNAPANMLEKLAHRFSYRFTCPHGTCPQGGHKLICTDWEYGALYRRCRRDYGDAWEAKFRERAETELLKKQDTQFFVGTVHQYPDSWIIVGIYRPPRPSSAVQPTLPL
jgi:hypothetical protein